MDPTKRAGGAELLWAKGEGEGYFGIGDFLFDVVVVGEADNFELWEVALESFRKPFRCDPEVEAVIGGDEKLHAAVLMGGRSPAHPGPFSSAQGRLRASGATFMMTFSVLDRFPSYPLAQEFLACRELSARCHAVIRQALT